MAIWLNPRGRSTYGIGICARCSRKMSIEDLFSDPNAPGLKVCKDDLDELDPYRLPARQTERINLPFARPDVPLTVPADNPLIEVRVTEDGEIRITQDDEIRILER